MVASGPAVAKRRLSLLALLPEWAPSVVLTLLIIGVYNVDSLLPHGPLLQGEVTRGAGLFHNWMHWDGGWYLLVYKQWYSTTTFQRADNFLPLFPGLIRLLHTIVPFLSPETLGVGLNVGAISAAMAFVDRSVADWPRSQRLMLIALLVTLPSAFFYTAFYTEALFTLGASIAVYGVVRDSPWITAFGAAFATYDRVIGVFLVIPLLFLLVRHRRLSDVGALALALCGLAALFATYAVSVHDPLAFVHAQGLWPDHPYAMGYNAAAAAIGNELFLGHGSDLASAAGLWECVLVAGLILLTLFYWRKDLAITGAVMFLATIVTGGYHSQLRYQLVLLPVWIGAVTVARRWRWARWAIVAAIFAGLALTLHLVDSFVRWGWVG